MATDSTTAKELMDASKCLECIPSGMLGYALLQATLANGSPTVTLGDVTLAVSDMEIGAVEIKDATSNTRAVVRTTDPDPGDAGIVVRIAGGALGGGLTDAELRASPVPVSISNFPASQSVTQGTSPWVVSGAVTTGGLTDAELRATPVPISGTITGITNPVAVTGTFFQATQPVSIAGTVAVSGPLTDAQLRATPVPVSGTTTSTNETVATATLANVSASATSVTALASSATRKAAYFFNDSTSFAYLKFGATASVTSFTVKVSPFGFYEIPQPVYTGVVDMIHDTATGTMRVTSL